MDAIVLWPRLAAVLPDDKLKSIDAARAPVDFLIVVAFYSYIYAIGAAAYVAAREGGRGLFVLVGLGGLAVGTLAYRAAVQSAIDYADQVRAAFDMYRFNLLANLRLPRPATRKEELRLWPEVTALIRSNEPRDWWVYAPEPKT
jgi:hypothetical protein